jgi:hypothetical protein
MTAIQRTKSVLSQNNTQNETKSVLITKKIKKEQNGEQRVSAFKDSENGLL